ncbi:MAG: DedA family protein [Chloroflexi bacterium]|nr:DedA family protein [Chloroflexota bacterium]
MITDGIRDVLGPASGWWALVGLFVIAYLAATLLPASSELAVIAMIGAGHSGLLVLSVATVGNVLGSCLSYVGGRWGAQWWRRRRAASADGDRNWADQHPTAASFLQRWGPLTLLFSWVPVVGDPLTVVAGAIGVGWIPFVALVTVGKLTRYAIVVGAIHYVWPGWVG